MIEKNKMSDIKTHQIRTFEEFGAVINEDNFAILMEQFIGVMEQYTRIKKVAPETIFKGFNWIEDGKTDILNPIINGVKMKDE